MKLAARPISLENSYSNITGRLEKKRYCTSGRSGEEKGIGGRGYGISGDILIVKMMNFECFADDFGRAAKPVMNMSIYRDNFQCACGKSHWFDEEIDIICEGLMKIMVVCPNDPTFLTSLKIKTFMVFKFKGFVSLAGTHLKGEEDMIAAQTIRSLVRMA